MFQIDLRPIFLLGVVVLLGFADSARIQRAASELNDAFKGRDVNKTIAKVEAILARNPGLPRLTRGEILALFENITKADAAKMMQQEPLKSVAGEKKPPQPEESLMVVLPFNANSDQTKGLEDLYTRQPVTRLVGYSTTTPVTPTSTTTSTERPKRKKKRKNNTRRKPMNQEIRPVYVDETKVSTSPPSSGVDLQWNPIVNEERPSVKKQNVNSDIDVPNYMKDTLDTFQNSNNNVFVTLPTQKPRTTQTTTTSPIQSSNPLPNISIAAQSLTPELKNLLVSLGLLNPDGTQVSMSLPTTTTTTHSPAPLIQYISINPTVDPASYVVFKPLPLANTRGKNRGNNEESLSEDMRHFLASFGLTGDSEGFRSQKSFDSGNRLRKSSGTTTTTTTNNPNSTEDDKLDMQSDDSGLPDINTDILTDDMKDVLENIGLVKKSRRKNKGVIFNPAMRTAGLLNQSEEKEKVDKLLSTIKELSAAEKNKSLSAEEVAEQLQNLTASLIDETKEENSSELELVEGESSEMNYEGYEPAEEELLKLQNGFIDEDLKDDFPVETHETDNNGNNSNNELSLDPSPFNSNPRRPSLKDSPNPPDPLSVEELHHFVENNKNEVKRQQPDNTTESSDEVPTTTESSSDSSTSESSSDDAKSNSGSSDSSASDSSSSSDASSDSSASAAGDSTSDTEDSSPSQDDLIDSFGGENPPENRPNGLYFLVDWNTFLRVGTDNKTVDLNFSPKVGDPKNFLPVTVP